MADRSSGRRRETGGVRMDLHVRVVSFLNEDPQERKQGDAIQPTALGYGETDRIVRLGPEVAPAARPDQSPLSYGRGDLTRGKARVAQRLPADEGVRNAWRKERRWGWGSAHLLDVGVRGCAGAGPCTGVWIRLPQPRLGRTGQVASLGSQLRTFGSK